MKACRHRNIVALLEAFRTTSGRVYVVLEYVGRTITKDMKSFPQGLPGPTLKLLMWQLITALIALHKQKVGHVQSLLYHTLFCVRSAIVAFLECTRKAMRLSRRGQKEVWS